MRVNQAKTALAHQMLMNTLARAQRGQFAGRLNKETPPSAGEPLRVPVAWSERGRPMGVFKKNQFDFIDLPLESNPSAHGFGICKTAMQIVFCLPCLVFGDLCLVFGDFFGGSEFMKNLFTADVLRSLVAFFAPLFVCASCLAECEIEYNGRSLSVICDDENDFVDIRELDGDLYVNFENYGSAEFLASVFVDTGDGDDFVQIVSLSASKNISVDTGSGNDEICGIGIFMGVNGNLSVDSGDGDDLLCMGIDLLVGKNIGIHMGAGNDTALTFFAPGTSAGKNFEVDGGDGIDDLQGASFLFAGKNLSLNNFEEINP